MKNKIIFAIFLTFILSPLTRAETRLEITNGVVSEILGETSNKSLEEALGTPQKLQVLKVMILNGEFKGENILIENQLTSNPVYDISLKNGDRVVVDVEKNSQKVHFFVSDKERMPILLLAMGLFGTAFLLLGRTKGAKHLFSTVITVSLVFLVMLPAILNGYPAVPVTIGVSILSVIATILSVSGLNRKSVASIGGSILSLLAIWLLSTISIKLASLSGLSGEVGETMWENLPKLNFKGILTAGMIIASLGAITNTGIVISNEIEEFKKNNGATTFKNLLKLGLEKGKDVSGAMTNTLITAYIGCGIPLFLLAINVPLQKFVNLDSVTTEVISAVVGSMGIILCVPITALLAAYLCVNSIFSANSKKD